MTSMLLRYCYVKNGIILPRLTSTIIVILPTSDCLTRSLMHVIPSWLPIESVSEMNIAGTVRQCANDTRVELDCIVCG